MSRFAQHAAGILEAAESAAAHGQACSEMTILIGREGAIHMVSDSDWPLDSLLLHHGAESAYRVTDCSNTVRLEGRDGLRRCLMESAKPHQIAKTLLGLA